MPRAERSWQPASQNRMKSKIVVRDFGGQLHAKYLSTSVEPHSEKVGSLKARLARSKITREVPVHAEPNMSLGGLDPKVLQ